MPPITERDWGRAGSRSFVEVPWCLYDYFSLGVSYILTCCVWLVCELRELVKLKHILVAGVVGRSVKVDVNISSVGNSYIRVVVFCGGCRCDADLRGK